MSEITEQMTQKYVREDMDDVLQRHRTEKKLLNGKYNSSSHPLKSDSLSSAKITQMRHSLAKGDKKKKKEVNKEIESMTEELQKKHENELKLFNGSHIEKVDQLADHLNNMSVAKEAEEKPEEPELVPNGIRYTETKISRAQRRREAKAVKEKQKEQRIKDDMIDDSENQRLIEAKKLTHILSSRGLALREIPSDGDCMYKAVEHQLSLHNVCTNVSQLRQKTCDHMKDNKLDFLPFLTSPVTHDLMSDAEYDQYCDEIATTKSWGGQLELRAISHVFRTPIEVIQTEGCPVQIGLNEYGTAQPLILW